MYIPDINVCVCQVLSNWVPSSDHKQYHVGVFDRHNMFAPGYLTAVKNSHKFDSIEKILSEKYTKIIPTECV